MISNSVFFFWDMCRVDLDILWYLLFLIFFCECVICVIMVSVYVVNYRDSCGVIDYQLYMVIFRVFGKGF